MSSQAIRTESEVEIWARLIDSQSAELSPEAAKYLLSIRFPETDHLRVQELADLSQAGTLTEAEASEFDRYLHVANLLAVMQSKARKSLNAACSSEF